MGCEETIMVDIAVVDVSYILCTGIVRFEFSTKKVRSISVVDVLLFQMTTLFSKSRSAIPLP
jgi:hypothetical protein